MRSAVGTRPAEANDPFGTPAPSLGRRRIQVEGSADELAKAGLTKASLELGRDDDALLRHGGTGVHVITHPASLEPEQDYYDSSDGLVLPATPEGHDEPASRLSFEAPGSAAAAAPAAAAAAAPCPPPPMAGARAVAAEAITPGEAPAPADAAARLPLFPATAPAAAAVAAAPAPAPPSAAAAAVGPGVGERGPVFSQDAHGGLAALASCELDLRPHTGKAHRLLAEGVDAGATAALGVASLAAGSGAGPGLAPAPSVTTLARDLQAIGAAATEAAQEQGAATAGQASGTGLDLALAAAAGSATQGMQGRATAGLAPQPPPAVPTKHAGSRLAAPKTSPVPATKDNAGGDDLLSLRDVGLPPPPPAAHGEENDEEEEEFAPPPPPAPSSPSADVVLDERCHLSVVDDMTAPPTGARPGEVAPGAADWGFEDNPSLDATAAGRPAPTADPTLGSSAAGLVADSGGAPVAAHGVARGPPGLRINTAPRRVLAPFEAASRAHLPEVPLDLAAAAADAPAGGMRGLAAATAAAMSTIAAPGYQTPLTPHLAELAEELLREPSVTDLLHSTGGDGAAAVQGASVGSAGMGRCVQREVAGGGGDGGGAAGSGVQPFLAFAPGEPRQRVWW